PRLHLPGNLQFVGGAPLRLPLFSEGLPLCVHGAADFVKTDERERVVIDVLETREDATPSGAVVVGRSCRRSRGFIGDAPQSRRATESDAAAAPLAIGCWQVFGDEDHLRGAADQLGLEGMGRRLEAGAPGRSVGWGGRRQPLTRFNVCVESDLKSKRVDVEAKA